jgi:hypothetical protein
MLKQNLRFPRNFKLLLYTLVLSSTSPAYASEKQIVLMEISPATATDYVVTAESREYQAVADFVLKQYAEKSEKCEISVKREFRHGSEEDLFKTVKSISNSAEQTIIVGLSRTNFARVAAKAANGTKLIGVSIGASSEQIHNINPNFVSVASPWTLQWEKIKSKMLSDGCTGEKIVGVFDPTNPISNHFRDSFRKDIFGSELLYSSLALNSNYKSLTKYPCVFITLNLSQSEQLLSAIDGAPTTEQVYGPGEWNMFDKELNSLLNKIKRSNLKIHIPTGWVTTAAFNSSDFSQHILKKVGRYPSPLGIYFHDALLISLEHLCGHLDARIFDTLKLKKIELNRPYYGITPGGNYLSSMHLINFQKNQGIYEER